MRRILYATLNIFTILMVLTACSKERDSSTPDKAYVYVLFSPEGFCNMGYNDLILKSIEKSSQKYGFEYSFYVPETVEYGMQIYNSWLDYELPAQSRAKSLFIFASGIYEEQLAQSRHPESDKNKEILLFETENKLPYAYTFDLSYYGASYLISSIYLNNKCYDFKVIAANPHTKGLNYITDGITAAINDNSTGSLDIICLGDLPYEGYENQEEAFISCKLLSLDDSLLQNVYIPYAGLSNMGVYRFSESNNRTIIGIDTADPTIYYYMIFSMNKRLDLAIDDFFTLWTNGEEVPKHRLYTLESGRVEVLDENVLGDSYSTYLDKAISKEREYFGF